MKKVSFILLLLSCFYANAQQKIRFDYDTAGNQTRRELCFICPSRMASDTIKDFSDLKESDLLKFYPEDVISYYPNPVKEELFLKWELTDDKILKTINVFNINGILLKSYESFNTSNSQNILFQQYPNGVYMISLMYNTGEEKTIKIIKQ